MNDICEACGGKCCVGIIEVQSADEIFYDDALVTVIEEFLPDRTMRMGDNLRCIALKDGKCSIYENRPRVCRAFQVGCPCCENFRNDRVTIHACEPCIVYKASKQA